MNKSFSIVIISFMMALISINAQAGTNEGVTCIDKGSTVTAEYDKANGQNITRDIVIGSSYKGGKCMGRCGAGCGRWWIPSSWTKDCLDHDICIADQNGDNDLANDANCGDEFNHASLDWATGVARGCSG